MLSGLVVSTPAARILLLNCLCRSMVLSFVSPSLYSMSLHKTCSRLLCPQGVQWILLILHAPYNATTLHSKGTVTIVNIKTRAYLLFKKCESDLLFAFMKEDKLCLIHTLKYTQYCIHTDMHWLPHGYKTSISAQNKVKNKVLRAKISLDTYTGTCNPYLHHHRLNT